MKYKGITQEQLSKKSGVHQGTISRFDNSVMHQSWVQFALANALGCDVNDLFIIMEEQI